MTNTENQQSLQTARTAFLAVLLCLGTATNGYADQAVPATREAQPTHPRFTGRCSALDMEAVPARWSDFEQRIVEWLSTCVTSRSKNAHREATLVRMSKTLAPLWRALPAGKPARIVPSYTWSAFRVERVEFSSPQARATGAPVHRPRPDTTPVGGVPRPPTDHSRQSPEPTPLPGQKPDQRPHPPGIQPPATIPDIDLTIPHEGNELILDARRLVDRLRATEQYRDADKLDLKIKTAKAVLLSLAGLAGAYYIGTKIRTGKLLLMWGWNASGARFGRIAARLERLVPEVEDALRDVIETARPHVRTAGAGTDWQVLDQLIDKAIPPQLDNAACGPACVQMALRDRGIDIAQDELIRRARATLPTELRSRRVSVHTLSRLFRELDPTGGWISERPLRDSFLQGKTPRQIIEALGQKGAWIAQVDAHFVIVDGFDKAGYLRIRDPWYEPGKERGIAAGSHYRVSMKTFFERWPATAVYRQ